MPREHVPVEQLVDLSRVGPGTRPPTKRELRAALPRGWALDDDGTTAHRDARLLFREGWILVVGMVCFGTVALYWFQDTLPKGWAGLGRFALAAGAVLLVGGVVGPLISKALMKR